MGDDLVLVGRVAGAFGVKGEVRITTFTAEPLGLVDYKTLLREDGSLCAHGVGWACRQGWRGRPYARKLKPASRPRPPAV